MKTKIFTVTFFFVFLFLPACNRPSWVLPEDKMEDVLFDIHLADAEIEGDYQTFNKVNQKKMYDAVLKKHGITSDQFDTSLVWYGSNLPKYIEIYENLQNRYKAIDDTLTAQLTKKNMDSTIGFENIWGRKSACILQSASLVKNHLLFDIDSASFEKGDVYEVRFDILGASAQHPIVLRFSILTADTLVSKNDTIRVNGSYITTLSLNPDQQAKTLYGSIHVPLSLPNSIVTINKLSINQRKAVLSSQIKD